MSGKTPGQRTLDDDWPAIAAHAAHHDIVNPAEALASWRTLSEERRVNWRASADAVQMLLGAKAAPQPDASGKTSGRAAYRAYSESFANIDNPGWDYLDDAERDRWEAAGLAVLDQAFPRLCEQLAIACGRLTGIALGNAGDPSVAADKALMAIREAGSVPAITGAGTEPA